MSANFEYAFARLIPHEGGYTDHPADRGGKTKFGVTEATWRAFCAEQRPQDRRGIHDITLDDAKAVYAHGFWAPLGLDYVKDGRIAYELFEIAVNCGPSDAATIAQRAVNLSGRALNISVKVDGRLGPITRTALNAISLRYLSGLLGTINVLQGLRYIEIAEKDATQADFFNGWMARCLAEVGEG